MNNFTFNDNFELLGVTLRCFVARQLLSRIYAILSVKFPGLKLRLCKKDDKYQVWQDRCPASSGSKWANVVLPAASLAAWYLGSDFNSCYKIGTLCTFWSSLAGWEKMKSIHSFQADFLQPVSIFWLDCADCAMEWRWTCLFSWKLCVARFVGTKRWRMPVAPRENQRVLARAINPP